MTGRLLRGISRLMFLRLCWRAPRTTIFFRPMGCPEGAVPAWRASVGFGAGRLTYQHNKVAGRGQAGVDGGVAGILRRRRPAPLKTQERGDLERILGGS